MPWKLEDLTGQRFGRLVVREQGPPKMYGKSMNKRTTWICDCDCGGEVTVLATSLKNGMTKSCGCLFKEIMSKPRKKNKYDLSGEYGIGYTVKGEEFYFDLEDYDKIKDFYWYSNNGYIVSRIIKNKKEKTILFHRYIMNAPFNMLVDHIGGSETIHDNRKSNLRIVTKQQNGMNHRIQTTNTSGKSGVWYERKINKWRARIYINSKDTHLGCFNTKEEAIQARLEAEDMYYKEYGFDYSQNMYKEGGIKQ